MSANKTDTGLTHKNHPARSPVLLPFLISHDSPYTLSQAQLIPRSPHLCPPKSLPTPKAPMASCGHPPRSNDLLRNSKHLYSCPVQSVVLPLNSPNTVPSSAFPSTHHILPSAEGIDNPGFLTSSPRRWAPGCSRHPTMPRTGPARHMEPRNVWWKQKCMCVATFQDPTSSKAKEEGRSMT